MLKNNDGMACCVFSDHIKFVNNFRVALIKLHIIFELIITFCLLFFLPCLSLSQNLCKAAVFQVTVSGKWIVVGYWLVYGYLVSIFKRDGLPSKKLRVSTKVVDRTVVLAFLLLRHLNFTGLLLNPDSGYESNL